VIQKTLFDTPTKLSRKSDKITSQASAAETEKELPRYQQELLAAIRSMMSVVSAREAGRRAVLMFGGMEDTYRKRILDLVRNGFVEEHGERRCEVSGKMATTYKLKEQS
jgi:hypothetical protein